MRLWGKKMKISKEEKEYLAGYSIEKYDRPSVATDIVTFAVMEEDAGNFRKDPVKKLKLLLIERASFPFRNYWALPGGFMIRGEAPEETAMRELKEETGISGAYLNPFAIFGAPGRDPRGWIVSHAYLALIDSAEYRVHTGRDAWKARWFDFSCTCEECGPDMEQKAAEPGNADSPAVIKTGSCIYSIRLACEDAVLTAKYRCDTLFGNRHSTETYKELESDGIAFDHGEIILRGFLNLRREAEHDGRIVFDLLPDSFTFNELQQTFEIVLGRELVTPNFRRKIAPLVRETDRFSDEAGHRPARLLERDPAMF